MMIEDHLPASPREGESVDSAIRPAWLKLFNYTDDLEK
jgi:hypothetical protein